MLTDSSITTLLVEDHEITRMGLRMMLERVPKVSIVAEASNGEEAIAKAEEFHPSLVLMDIGLPGVNGIQATKAIKESSAAKVIIITSHDTEADAIAGLDAGADAYCLKGVSFPQLVLAIQTVMDEAMWLSPGIARLVLKSAREKVTAAPAQTSVAVRANRFGLSTRELEVLALLADGLTNQEIGSTLYLSSETIKTHVRHLMQKLCVTDRTQAAVKAMKEGLIFVGEHC